MHSMLSFEDARERARALNAADAAAAAAVATSAAAAAAAATGSSSTGSAAIASMGAATETAPQLRPCATPGLAGAAMCWASNNRSAELNPRYKSQLCRSFMDEGPDGCRFGDDCLFAHGAHELRVAQKEAAGGYEPTGYPVGYAQSGSMLAVPPPPPDGSRAVWQSSLGGLPAGGVLLEPTSWGHPAQAQQQQSYQGPW